MNCPKCGKVVNDNATFCPFCGQSLADNGTMNQNNQNEMNIQHHAPQQTNTNKFKLVSAIVMAIISLLMLITIPVFGIITSLIGIICGFIGMRKPEKKKWSQIGLIASAVIMVLCFVMTTKNASTDNTANQIANNVSETQTGNENSSTDDAATNNETAENNAVTVTDDDSVKELISIIDKAEATMKKSIDDLEAAKQEENASEEHRKEAEVMNAAATELEGLRDDVNKIQNIDKQLMNAADGYFDMTIASRKQFAELEDFFAEYLKFDYAGRPNGEDYGGEDEDYINTLTEWYLTNKEVIDSINSVPSCVETEWNNYKNTFELNATIIQRLNEAIAVNDMLRLWSSVYLSNRYDVTEENGYNALLDCLKGEIDFSNYQAKMASKLAEEMHSYVEMDGNSRENYEFENLQSNKIGLTYDAVETIYPALFNTYDAFVVFKTGCINGNRTIVIESEIPGFTQVYKQSFNLDSSYKAIYIKPAALTGELDLSSAKDAQINISIYEKDGTTLIDSKTFPVTIKSINDMEWRSDEFGVSTQDNILCYLTPNADAIDTLKRNAIQEITNISGGVIESLVGYQPSQYGPYVGTYIQAAGIMRAMYDMGVRYNTDGFSISGSNQHILFPTEVLEKQSGLCIETSLTVASALQSADLHAFLVFPPGHAQVAVEVWNDGSEGTGEYFLIETTALSDDNNNDDIYCEYCNALLNYNPDDLSQDWPIAYYSADEWQTYLSENGAYVIDCNDSQTLGLTPFAN